MKKTIGTLGYYFLIGLLVTLDRCRIRIGTHTLAKYGAKALRLAGQNGADVATLCHHLHLYTKTLWSVRLA